MDSLEYDLFGGMMKIYVSLSKIWSANTINLLQKSGCEVSYNKNGSTIPEDQLSKLINDVDGVLAGMEIYTHDTLCNCKKLKCISRVGESKSNIDCNGAEKNGITICTVPAEIRLKYVAEMTVAALLGISYNIVNKPGLKIKNITNSNILIFGYNALSISIISLLKGFGVNISVYDKNNDVPFEYFCSLRKEIMNSDIIIVASELSKILPGDMTIFEYMAKSTIVLDVPGNKTLANQVRNLISKGLVSIYWTTLDDEDVVEIDRCLYCKYTNFHTIKYLKEIEEVAAINLINQLGSD